MAEASSWIESQAQAGASKWAHFFGGSKRQKRARQFYEITGNNIEIARDLMKQAEQMQKKGNRKDADKLLLTVEKLVHNNDKIINVGGEVVDETK